MPTWIKICATTSIEDALTSVAAGADALGFIFAPSPRRISPEQAREIADQLPGKIERVGVFVNQPAEFIRAVVEQAGLTAVQLHGQETPEFVAGLFGRGGRIGVIKTILANDKFEATLALFRRNPEYVDSILLDSGAGSGKAFEWDNIQPHVGGHNMRFIIAGGLNPENVGEAVQKFSPWGVDVVSGVERGPGRKDPKKLQAFVAAVRKADQQ